MNMPESINNKKTLSKVAFLDRDGVINVDFGYTYKVSDFVFTQGCVEALQQLQQQGFAIIVVTNQSGIARGYYSEEDYLQLTQWYCEQLQQQGVTISDVFYCPHGPDDGCTCRKPLPGLFYQAAEKYHIDFSNALMVGDKVSDIQAAHAAGIRRYYCINSDVAQQQAALDTLSNSGIVNCRVGHNLLDCVQRT